MRLFNLLVYEGWVPGNVEVFSTAEYNEILGRADDLRFQINVMDGTGATPLLTAKYYQSNNNQEFESNNTLHNATIASYPTTVWGGSNSAVTNGGYGKVGLISDSGKKLYVRVWAVGRGT
jgi:hypothetical protein